MTSFILIVILLPVLIFAACNASDEHAGNPAGTLDPELRKSLSGEFKSHLMNHILNPWYPASVDEESGGFNTRFNYQWNADDQQPRMIVSQSRLIWTASIAAEFVDDKETDRLLKAAEHGFHYLKEVMWDQEYGGFYNQVSREDSVVQNLNDRTIKEAYGNAFAIYGLAAYVKATGNQDALELAVDTFQWLETHSYDAEHGGYFNIMERDGTPLTTGLDRTPPKDQNSSIHLLEAFTELYHVWPDPLLEERLNEMLTLIRDTIRIDPGYLVLFSEADWTPVSYRDSSDQVREENYYFDHVSFGHDVETAFLMIEASETLGIRNDSTTHHYAKQMVDHSLKTGWDHENGGFYDGGYYFDKDEDLVVVRDTKTWWAQAEGLNALLLMSLLYPDDEMEYQRYFLQMWDYINEYFIDHEYGGWYESGLDKSPDSRYDAKGHIWKTNYHDGRAMMNGIRLLNKLQD
ncbi:AGE family epimerase/isomerase [Rhodohalobacter sp. SW132]|uniref:AGE family epimerase/isomerase n=1 Tax=Rhodohalobacter sp. SW132 TaxID=2293433 RepID=UPI001313EBAC|nr:AGE family epimerase/isomerase [Rhodohalobacter sp. SW132]